MFKALFAFEKLKPAMFTSTPWEGTYILRLLAQEFQHTLGEQDREILLCECLLS